MSESRGSVEKSVKREEFTRSEEGGLIWSKRPSSPSSHSVSRALMATHEQRRMLSSADELGRDLIARPARNLRADERLDLAGQEQQPCRVDVVSEAIVGLAVPRERFNSKTTLPQRIVPTSTRSRSGGVRTRSSHVPAGSNSKPDVDNDCKETCSEKYNRQLGLTRSTPASERGTANI